ncbi:hypothetical protein IFM89_009128 [Coptis chinensis]|uniref:FAR1 domain-containing protein n=1 Tax=Coptis chinensis TaxID=261450 RepID=A0A835HUY7_9MAGN|nr:hypothetical protein IFM89_009128 [Coptis chinensis]
MNSPTNEVEHDTQFDELGCYSIQTPNEDVDILGMPKVGMIFRSLEDAKSYYYEFGQQNGFESRARSTQKKAHGDDSVTVCEMVCAREGTHTKKQGNAENDIKRRTTSTIKLASSHTPNKSTASSFHTGEIRLVTGAMLQDKAG